MVTLKRKSAIFKRKNVHPIVVRPRNRKGTAFRVSPSIAVGKTIGRIHIKLVGEHTRIHDVRHAPGCHCHGEPTAGSTIVVIVVCSISLEGYSRPGEMSEPIHQT